MTGLNRSQVRVEDARDALTMHQLMEAEGRELMKLMEQLEQDPACAVPEGLDARCLDAIEHSCRKRRRTNAKHTAAKVFRYLAAATLVASLLFITAFAAIAEVRVGTLNFLAEVTGSYTRYKLVPAEEDTEQLPARLPAADTETLLGYRFPRMPEGFELYREYKTTTQSSSIYRREDGAEIYVTVSYFALGNASVSTGDAQVEELTIHGYEGQLIRRSYVLTDGATAPWSQVLWGNTREGVLVSLTGYRVEGETLLELAEQAEWVGLSENADRPVLMGYRLPKPPEGYWLETCGRTPTEHYAQYRGPKGDMICFRISKEEMTFDEYEGYFVKQMVFEDTTVRGLPARLAHSSTNIRSLMRPKHILLWNEEAPNGGYYYCWIECTSKGSAVLYQLAEDMEKIPD